MTGKLGKTIFALLLVLSLMATLASATAMAAGDPPTVVKSPTGEVVDEGGYAAFVAHYANANVAVWHFVAPDGSDYTYEEAIYMFPDMTIQNGMYSTMKLYNIPYALDGWQVYCRYSNINGSTNTDSALITVNPKVPPTATPEPTPEPTPAPEATPAPAPAESSEGTEAPAEEPAPPAAETPKPAQSVSGQESAPKGLAGHTGIVLAILGAALALAILFLIASIVRYVRKYH